MFEVKMKLLQILLIVSLQFSLRAMEVIPESDLEEDAPLIDTSSAIEPSSSLKKHLRHRSSGQNGANNDVLKCYRCDKRLVFQNELNLQNSQNTNILCPKCDRELNNIKK